MICLIAPAQLWNVMTKHRLSECFQIHEKNRQTENQVHPFPYKTEQAGLTIDLLITKSKYETEFSTQMFMKLWVPLRRVP